MKKKCKNGHEVPDGARFCPQCGEKMQAESELRCFKCGNKLSEGEKYCPECGCPAPPPLPAHSTSTKPEKYPSETPQEPPALPLPPAPPVHPTGNGSDNSAKKLSFNNPFVKGLLLIVAIILAVFIFTQVKSCTEDTVKPAPSPNIDIKEIEKDLTLREQIEAQGWHYVGSVSVYNIVLDKEIYKSQWSQCLFRKGDEYMLYNDDPKYLDHVTSFYTTRIQRVSIGNFRYLLKPEEIMMNFNARAEDCVFNI